ncbi:hypothetical protein BOX15_Mlig021028g4 [Macrostomum lignano]|uniref:Uncharacterized protein n=2 Tax=Macrostomum lignano TaxID=282301 RepID=A0A267H0A7_9PLAT|nr:hypothetical protein BOX15_Mlig021028g4 [Macrostomum lignano]
MLLPLLVLSLLAAQTAAQSDNVTRIGAQFLDSSVSLTVGRSAHLSISLNQSFSAGDYLYFTYQADSQSPVLPYQERQVVLPLPAVYLPPNATAAELNLTGWDAGRLSIGVNSTNPDFFNNHSVFVRVTVAKSDVIDDFNFVVGILYVVLWSMSFYPQTVLNYRRKSVVGLNFDFIGLNLLGFCAYAAFNVCLYWVAPVQELYFRRHPRGVIPVEIADVVFALHAVVITSVQVVQCCLYERGGQRMSLTARLLLAAMLLFLLATLLVSAFWQAGFDWLNYLYCVSYVKLTVTLIKYSPQAYMNYKRQSTDGWSIGTIFTDFSGGALSILQMLLLAYNYNDWPSIMGDPTKFGLGLVSILSDCVFFVQHYGLYGEPARRRRQRRLLRVSATEAADSPAVNQPPTAAAEQPDEGQPGDADDGKPLLG